MNNSDFIVFFFHSAVSVFAVSTNQNEINKTKKMNRTNMIWTVLIDKINYSTHANQRERGKTLKNWKHRYWFICGIPFKLAHVCLKSNDDNNSQQSRFCHSFRVSSASFDSAWLGLAWLSSFFFVQWFFRMFVCTSNATYSISFQAWLCALSAPMWLYFTELIFVCSPKHFSLRCTARFTYEQSHYHLYFAHDAISKCEWARWTKWALKFSYNYNNLLFNDHY